MRQIVDGPFASLSGLGQVLPYCFGVNLGLPAIPLRTGAQSALAVTATPTDTTLFLDDLEALKRFPDGGRGEIGAERFTWAARNLTNVSLEGVVRHTEGT